MSNLERKVVDIKTGQTKMVPLTDAEIADANARTAAEQEKRDAEQLEALRKKACDAELAALVDIETGKTKEAKEYQAEKVKQGK